MAGRASKSGESGGDQRDIVNRDAWLMRVRKGDVLMVRLDGKTSEDRMLGVGHAFRHTLDAAGHNDVPILMMEPGIGLMIARPVAERDAGGSVAVEADTDEPADDKYQLSAEDRIALEMAAVGDSEYVRAFVNMAIARWPSPEADKTRLVFRSATDGVEYLAELSRKMPEQEGTLPQ